ncbi:hypothetical protein B0H14DRAFT_1603918 [Mycena olivaceomarginata]|nr:hypothetical protein B0H14DRAFT_1603918 [Mycena olivaceomarginata]
MPAALQTWPVLVLVSPRKSSDIFVVRVNPFVTTSGNGSRRGNLSRGERYWRGAKTFTPNRRATATLNFPTLAILNWLASALGAGSAAFWLSHPGPKRYILRRLIRLAVIQRVSIAGFIGFSLRVEHRERGSEERCHLNSQVGEREREQPADVALQH